MIYKQKKINNKLIVVFVNKIFIITHGQYEVSMWVNGYP